MIYELRTYEARLGQMKALQARFEQHTLRFFQKHGITAVGFWTPHLGEWSNQLIFMLSYEDLGARERAWAAFQADPDWQRVAAETDKDGPLVARLHSAILKPTSFSPMR